MISLQNAGTDLTYRRPKRLSPRWPEGQYEVSSHSVAYLFEWNTWGQYISWKPVQHVRVQTCINHYCNEKRPIWFSNQYHIDQEIMLVSPEFHTLSSYNNNTRCTTLILITLLYWVRPRSLDPSYCQNVLQRMRGSPHNFTWQLTKIAVDMGDLGRQNIRPALDSHKTSRSIL